MLHVIVCEVNHQQYICGMGVYQKKEFMLKAKISTKYYVWAAFMTVILVFGVIRFIVHPIIDIMSSTYDSSAILFTTMFAFLILFLISILRHFKIITLHFNERSLKSHSLFHPFGKTLYFKDYKGIYNTTETGSGGTYEVMYLVDHNNITRFKIMGLYYKNMDEIIAAIPLPAIKRNLSGKEYLKLMFTGRVNLSKIKDKKNTDSKIAFYFKVFSIVTIAIFVIGMLIRFYLR